MTEQWQLEEKDRQIQDLEQQISDLEEKVSGLQPQKAVTINGGML